MRISVKAASASLTTIANGDWLWINRALSVNLSSYDTIQELVDYLDAQPLYEALVASGAPDTDLSTELDAITASNFLAVKTTLTGTATSLVLAVSSITDFNVGDYITVSTVDNVWEEMRRITAIGIATLTIDSALSSITTYVSGSKVRECLTLSSDLDAVIDWINAGNTGYVTAAYPATTWALSTTYIVGDVVLPSTANGYMYVCLNAGTSGATEPAAWATSVGNTTADGTMTWICRSADRSSLQNIPDTFLLGGSEGTATQTHWDTALDLLKTEDTQLISCVTYDPAVWAALSSHCSYMSTVGKKERLGFCGGFATADGYTSGLGKWSSTTLINNSIDQMEKYALQLNTDRMIYVGPGFKAYDENGLLTT
jgi:hypothetical protein